MGDGLKLSKDKRHRSSSSLAGLGVEGTRSERKLDIRGLIPEVDNDHFAIAESRCEDLQEKIDVVKTLKRKKKINKRSVTRVNEPLPESIPFITVKTQPKKKVSQQASRIRRLEEPPNPTRGYLDPATVEQHRMLGQVWGYGQDYNQVPQNVHRSEPRPNSKARSRRLRSEGDGMYGHVMDTAEPAADVACGQDIDSGGGTDKDLFDQGTEDFVEINDKAGQMDSHTQAKSLPPKRKLHTRDTNLKQVPKWIDSSLSNPRTMRSAGSTAYRRRQAIARQQQNSARDIPKYSEQDPGHSIDVLPAESKKEGQYHHPRRLKYRSRGYEMPTVASQMKQVDIRYHCSIANRTNIPFVVSKSCAPSHNIGVNIQQVLNGLKIQQPLNGIPLTIAHHMGLGHVPSISTKSSTTQPSLDNREINAIKLGRRLLLLPSYKYISYNRLLTLYREGDGMVPRFLRAISRPNYFYTSMYNLATNREDLDGATSKGRCGNHEAKQHLAEYASLYREYEQVERQLKEVGSSPDLERRRDGILRELSTREDHIRKLVQDSSSIGPGEFNLASLRASASTADDGFRLSNFKFNSGDQPQ